MSLVFESLSSLSHLRTDICAYFPNLHTHEIFTQTFDLSDFLSWLSWQLTLWSFLWSCFPSRLCSFLINGCLVQCMAKMVQSSIPYLNFSEPWFILFKLILSFFFIVRFAVQYSGCWKWLEWGSRGKRVLEYRYYWLWWCEGTWIKASRVFEVCCAAVPIHTCCSKTKDVSAPHGYSRFLN